VISDFCKRQRKAISNARAGNNNISYCTLGFKESLYIVRLQATVATDVRKESNDSDSVYFMMLFFSCCFFFRLTLIHRMQIILQLKVHLITPLLISGRLDTVEDFMSIFIKNLLNNYVSSNLQAGILFFLVFFYFFL